MMHGYFKMDNVLCCIVSDTLLFMCKIRIFAMSMAYPCRVWGIIGLQTFGESKSLDQLKVLSTFMNILCDEFSSSNMNYLFVALQCLLHSTN